MPFAAISRSISRLLNWRRTDADNKPVLFPFYKLPWDVQEHIVGFMTINDIIQGAILSPNFRIAAARGKTKLLRVSMTQKKALDDSDPRDEVRRVFQQPAPTIRISVERPFRDYHIRFYWLENNKEKKKAIDRFLRRKRRVKISEDLLMVVVEECDVLIYNSNPSCSKLSDYQFILDGILGTFRVQNFALGERSPNLVMPKEILFPVAHRYRNSVHSLLLYQSYKSTTCANLTTDEVFALLDNLELQDINVCWVVEPGARYTGPLKTKKMRFTSAPWLTIDSLLTMDCELLYASDVSLTTLELRAFLRKWQEGGFEKLKKCTLLKQTSEENWEDLLDVFEVEVTENRALCIRGSGGRVAKVSTMRSIFQFDVID